MTPPNPDLRTERSDQDGPSRLGPYRVLDTLDVPGHAEDAPRCLARDDRTGRVVILTFPHASLAEDTGYAVRFRAEAENSRRLRGRWVAPVLDVAPAGADLPWIAHDCVPALPLPAALAAHGGPLPEPTVRAVGAALAESLAAAHANGLVHAGISPGSVLLTPDGPRLTGYGLARAASPDAGRRVGVPHDAVPSTLPPERPAGQPLRPHDDLYALGAVLVYAATGRVDADPDDLPAGLRAPIAACLSPDPAERPEPGTLARAFTTGGTALPDVLRAALAAQAARHPVTAPLAPPAAPEPAGSRPRPSRRAVTLGALSGAAGLALGAAGAGVGRALTGEPRRSRPVPQVRGTAPAPLWRLTVDQAPNHPPLIWRGSVALLMGEESLSAVRLRDGKHLWSRNDLWPSGSLTLLSGGLFLKPSGTEFSAVSVRTGKVVWTERRYDGSAHPLFISVWAADGHTLWFLAGSVENGKDPGQRLVAYDVARRRELWRASVPSVGGTEFSDQGVAWRGAVLVPGTLGTLSEKPWSYLALDARSGRKLWKRSYHGVSADAEDIRGTAPGDLLISYDRKTVQAHDLSSGERRWRFTAGGYLYTSPAVHGRTLFATDEHNVTYAIDTRRGEQRWRHDPAVTPNATSYAETVLSHAGRTVFQQNDAEVAAFDAADGSPRWRFAPAGTGQRAGGFSGYLTSAPGMAVVVNGATLYALPVD
ncbi:outer membrane protein assembly factor BamB family protein [Streptomyces coffeae]|uniref:PQQ-binding-like beta-propeller repeat protein n=1 Tax=Streptomyces coffeae TaxID=621382 RepID=A0ABS1NQX7_9ACTN|nr:PQQ-binding-like beta-propeller repeat protein [Streptomyces coffeae]MBL1102345.1 PQQ-binding-like beta-propeller repeat protein [Streptomyces coffeae]